MEWISDHTNLDRVGYDLMTDGRETTPLCCVDPRVHVYAHKQPDGRGGLWVWCDRCGRYAHVDRVPINTAWENADNINFRKITAEPKYLNDVNEEVDDCVRRYKARLASS